MDNPENLSETEILQFASAQFKTYGIDKFYAKVGTPFHLFALRYQHGEVFESSGFGRESVEAEHEITKIRYGRMVVGVTTIITGVALAHYFVGPSLTTPQP